MLTHSAEDDPRVLMQQMNAALTMNDSHQIRRIRTFLKSKQSKKLALLADLDSKIASPAF
jgi:hypothetical protein